MNKIKSLLIPAAGLGSRLFPTSWAIPKELFPVGDKPALHLVLDEALKAGINIANIITSPRKEALHTYLSYKDQTNNILLLDNERKRLQELSALNNAFTYNFLIQEQAKGVGDAIFKAKNIIQDSFFAMAYPDDLLEENEDGFSNLVTISERYNASVLLLEEVSYEDVSKYGIVSFSQYLDSNIIQLDSIVEKPKKEEAPSKFSIIGRYILSRKIFHYFDMQQKEAPCYVTALNLMIKNKEPLLGLILKSKRHDIGTKKGWLKAVNYFSQRIID